MIYRKRYKRYRKRYKRYRKGVGKGYRHVWGYKGVWDETKLGRGRGWRINFTATKRRRHRGMGSFGVGTTGAWRIRGVQYIRKTGMNTYQTQLIGYKYPMKFNVRSPKRYKRRY